MYCIMIIQEVMDMRYLKKAVIFISMICMAVGCTQNTPKEQIVHVALSVYDASDAFINEITARLLTLSKEKSHGKIYRVDVYDGAESQTVQNAQMDEFIYKKYDIVWMNLVDRTAASTIINKAEKADIPTIFFNREPVESDMKLWNKVFYVGSKSEQSGYLQGQIILDQYLKNPYSIDKNHDGIIQYVILEGELGHQDASLRSESCLKPFQEKNIQMERLGSEVANWKRSQGAQQMQNLLQKYGNSIEVVFSNNDEMALGAIESIKKSNAHVKVVGIDGTKEALQAVMDGELAGTVLNDAKQQAKNIFEITKALKGGGYELNMLGLNAYNEIHVDFVKITKESLQTVMKENGLSLQ